MDFSHRLRRTLDFRRIYFGDVKISREEPVKKFTSAPDACHDSVAVFV